MSDNEYAITIDIPAPPPIPGELRAEIGQMLLTQRTQLARAAGAFKETSSVPLVDRPEYKAGLKAHLGMILSTKTRITYE